MLVNDDWVKFSRCYVVLSAGDSRHCGGEDGRVGLGVKNRQHPRQPEPRRTPCRPAETSPQNRRAYQTDTRQLLRPVPRCCSESALFISNNVPTSDAVIRKLIFSFWGSLRKSGSVVIYLQFYEVRFM